MPKTGRGTLRSFETMTPYQSISELAARRGIEPIDAVLAMIRHPDTVVTFSGAGAHVATTVNPIHGHLLGHRVRTADTDRSGGVRLLPDMIACGKLSLFFAFRA